MKLTKDNYFTPENKYLSNSKISDWLTCKNFFYRKHITHELHTDRTTAMVKGSAVDDLLTQDVIKSKYWVGDGRTKEAKDMRDAGFEVISETTYNEIMGMACAVEDTTAFKELKDFTTQDILQVEDPLGPHFIGLCGIPDFYKVSGKKCTIVDLKTAANVDTVKYHYHCLDFGYYRQMAMYAFLLSSKYPEIEEFEFKHIVVEKKKDIWPVKTFTLNRERIETEEINLANILNDIANETEFKKQDASWENAEEIGEQYEETL
jgi:hypothetical protein